MKLNPSLFSPDALRSAFAGVVGRFPVTVAYLSLLSIWLIILIIDDFGLSSGVIESVTWPLSEGLLMSLAVKLWCEFMRAAKRSTFAQIIVAILVIVDFAFLMLRGGVSASPEYIGRSAIVTALAVAIVFIPSAPGLNERSLWCYSIAQLGAAAASVLLSIIFFLSVTIIFGTIGQLFGFNDWKVASIVEVIFSMFVASVFYLSRLPERDAIAQVDSLPPRSSVGAFCKNVMLPILTVYTIVLYVYLLKVLFTWTLPQDSISLMVTGLMCVSLVTLFGIQRYSFTPAASPSAIRIAALARRILPLLLLPLLVLMSIGVIYRVGEYGVTVSRLYVITFNIWAYIVVGYLILKRRANLNLVAGSFAIVFVLVSVIPGANLSTYATNSIRASVIRTLTEAGVTELPISVDRLKEVIAGLPLQQGENLASRVDYLDDWNDHSRIKDIVVSDEYITYYSIKPHESAEVLSIIHPYRYSGPVDIPGGYTSVERITDTKIDIGNVYDSIAATSDADFNMPRPLVVERGDTVVYVITWIKFNRADESEELPLCDAFVFRK